MFSAIFGTDAIDSGNKPALVDPKKAKVLFDYDAVDSTEISVWANQVKIYIILYQFEGIYSLTKF